jgi:8-oxo-dGTP pyrophosphatase MutT (NUDIX family)
MNLDPERLRRVLAARSRHALAYEGFREAAVLVPVVADAAGDRILFIVRPSDLIHHGGQIAFPGGKRDPEDADLATTALREAEEELGIARERVTTLGFLDDVPTPTGFMITPVVGLMSGPLRVAPNAGEVAAAFTCGMTELPRCYRQDGIRTYRGVSYEMHEYHAVGQPLTAGVPDGEQRIWGATARIVHQLLTLI